VPDAPTYRERLHVPLRWWVQGTMLVASLWLAFVVAVPAALALVIAAVAALLLAAGLRAYGAAQVQVAGGWLQAGRARIEVGHLGAAEALDAERTRRVAGVEADARAYLLLRPYLKQAVRVAIEDPADPAPYWLISTRHPDRLAAAITAACASQTPLRGQP
jgi:hypothetical protein